MLPKGTFFLNRHYQQLIIAKRRTLTVDVLYRQLTRWKQNTA